MTRIQRFCHYELRTTDVDAARAFYASLFGKDFWGQGVGVAPLPEQAAARGAPAHWLGHIGVDDVDATVSRLVAAGAEPRGPAVRRPDGWSRVGLQDPAGAGLAVSSATPPPPGEPVAWHMLHARDEGETLDLYCRLFGWRELETIDAGEHGIHRTFGWGGAGDAAGSAASIANKPHIHPQWLFFFHVPDMEQAVAKVRAAGGVVIATARTWTGALLTPCDDPQGAAFGLYQRSR